MDCIRCGIICEGMKLTKVTHNSFENYYYDSKQQVMSVKVIHLFKTGKHGSKIYPTEKFYITACGTCKKARLDRAARQHIAEQREAETPRATKQAEQWRSLAQRGAGTQEAVSKQGASGRQRLSQSVTEDLSPPTRAAQRAAPVSQSAPTQRLAIKYRIHIRGCKT